MDTILFNAKINIKSSPKLLTAIAISGDRISAIGSDVDILNLKKPNTSVCNLEGKRILPGLTDAHVHFDWYAKSLQAVDVNTDSIQECFNRVSARSNSIPEGEWIIGNGWNQEKWGGSFPTANELNKVTPNHPVALRALSGHALWVNSLTMKIAGISSDTPDPAGGKIERDSKGFPTGILFEAATGLIKSFIPEPSPNELSDLMIPAMENCWKLGITGVHDYSTADAFIAYQMLIERKQMGIRVVKNLRAEQLDDAVKIGLRTGFGNNWLKIGSLKLFKDGALGVRTAHLLEPYIGTNSYGIEVIDNDTLHKYCSKASLNGLALTIHAIGDRACRDVLDIFDIIRKEEKENGQIPLRHRLEHIQILHPDDFNRLGELGIIASMQPIAATTDMMISDKYLGPRCDGAYAWRTQLNAGAILAFGSDAPVDSINPFLGIHAAVTRRRADGFPDKDGWCPKQRLSVQEAVDGFTAGAAYAGYMENEIGSLEPGKLADLVVIDRDIYICNPMEIKDTKVLATMIEGEWKYNET